ncbi:hypothetical protein BC828DRAFT_382937 [Blastocladiella britannica]|nr:hypothetical protein BC828DRAFT_382937 [Blastocladiella britannica]
MALLYHGDIATLILEHAASHTTSLIDGIKLLHVLPPAEQPRTRAIILARGFVRPALAVTLGYARLLQDFPAWLVLDAREPILYALASIGDVETLASFYAESTRAITHDPLTIDAVYDSVLLQAVYASNHVPVFEWFHCQKWNLNNRPWLTKEGTCCPVPVLEWALDKRYVNLDGFDQELWAASKAGEMPVLEWFQGQQHRRGRPCASEAPRVIPDAATAGVQLGVLDWWWTSVALCTFPTPIDFAIFSRVALSTGSLDMVLWWWTKFETHRTPEHRFGSRGAANMAISSCSLPVIQWLWAVAARPDAADLLDDWTDAKLATLPTGRFVGSLALVQWWVETQLPSGHAALPWTRYNTYTCASIGAADVLDYILARPDQSATEWGVELVSTALRFRQQRVLECPSSLSTAWACWPGGRRTSGSLTPRSCVLVPGLRGSAAAPGCVGGSSSCASPRGAIWSRTRWRGRWWRRSRRGCSRRWPGLRPMSLGWWRI